MKPVIPISANDRDYRFVPSENAVNVFHDYKLHEKIHETNLFVAYHASRTDHEQACVVKVLKSRYPSPSAIALFRKESSIIEALALDGVVQSHGLIEIEDKIAIVMEDWSGRSLKEDFYKNKNLRLFLDMGISLSNTLGNLHQNNIIFRDINPDNILANPETGEVKLTNFGLESILNREHREIVAGNVAIKALIYLSPEQSGRTHVSIDHRSDLYSLGMVFYEMLSGGLPFQTNDIHAILTKDIIPLCHMNTDIPAAVSRIVMKLLTKNPDDRYQNAFGLLADLRKCHHRLIKYGTIEPFEIGRNDIPVTFIVPKMVLGRENEKKVISETFDKVKNGSNEMVLISGPAGVGKTAFVNEIGASIINDHGFFISGKCAQYMNDSPYSAAIQAFTELIKQILSESDEKIQIWKEQLLEALGPNGKLMTDVIPLLEVIIGKQPEIGEVDTHERRILFDLTSRNFIKVFATEEHPLTIFTDDLQWIDRATLNLTAIVDQSIKYFFFIGAFRENDVGASHPVAITIDKILQKRDLQVLGLGGLSREDTHTLLKGFLKNSDEESLHLAHLVWEKTGGNPFFINQWMKNLYEMRMLILDPDSGWRWDLEKIQEIKVSNNVLALLGNKIDLLQDEVKDTLKICACMGSSLDLDHLTMVITRSVDRIIEDLLMAADAGLIIIKGEKIWFQHDQIQEAIYTSIPAPERESIHYRIGRAFLEMADDAQCQENLFYIVDQFDQAHALITDLADRLRLAELNFKAGLKAKDSSAFASALRYFTRGASLLPDHAWRDHYKLTFDLKTNQAKSNYILGNHDEAAQLFSEIMTCVQSDYDRAEVYIIRILLLTNKSNYKEALNLGLDALDMVGCRLSRNPGKMAILAEYLRMKYRLRNRGIESLVNLPINENREMRLAIRIMESMSQAVTYINLNLRILIIIRCMNIMITYGHSYISPYVAAAMVPIVGSAMGDTAKARKLTALSFTLMDVLQTRSNGHSYFMLAYFALHWQQHARDCIVYFRKANVLLREVGSFNFVCHSLNNIIDYSFMIGRNMDESFGEYKRHEDFIRSLKDPFFTDYFTDNLRKYDCLQGRTDSPTTLDKGDGYEARRQATMRERKNDLDTFEFNCNKIKLLYLAGNTEGAYTLAEQSAYLQKRHIGNFVVPEFVFFHALSAAAAYPGGNAAQRKKISALLKKSRKMMKKWADNCPDNFQHKFLLIAAEQERIEGRQDEAIILYRRAIRSSADAEYINNEGIISERLAGYLLDLSKTTEAATLIRRAHSCFKRWGAFAKLRDLEANYEPYLAHIDYCASPPVFGDRRKKLPQTMDLTTVIKAAQAIAGETSYTSLLEKMVKIIIENAGARKGLVILKSRDHLCVEAAGTADGDEITILQSIPVDEYEGLSSAIVNYVAMTHEVICLDRAFSEGRFVHDPYVLKNKPKSILCCPMLSKNILVGILYLENNLVEGVFTPERLDLLNMLSSQIAISMDNVTFYGQLEETVKERTKDLQKTVRELNMEVNRRRLAEEDLRVSHYRLAKVLDSTTDTIIIVNQLREVAFFNKGAEALFRCTVKEILGQPVGCLMPEAGQAFFDAQVGFLENLTEADGKKKSFVMAMQCRDGSQFQANIALAEFTIEDDPFYSLIIRPAADESYVDTALIAGITEGQGEGHQKNSGKITRSGVLKRTSPLAGDIVERFSALENAIKDISHQLNPQYFEEYQSREKISKLMVLALLVWENSTKKTKIELAEESGLWKAYCDGGTWRTRTLDKYLSPETLPKNPRYQDVIKTVEYVLSRCSGDSKENLELNAMLITMKETDEKFDGVIMKG